MILANKPPENPMDSEQQEMCRLASGNACALEKMMLTPDDVMELDQDSAQDIIERCEQIIHCMRVCRLSPL